MVKWDLSSLLSAPIHYTISENFFLHASWPTNINKNSYICLWIHSSWFSLILLHWFSIVIYEIWTTHDFSILNMKKLRSERLSKTWWVIIKIRGLLNPNKMFFPLNSIYNIFITYVHALDLYVSYTKICLLKYQIFTQETLNPLQNINSFFKSFTINSDFFKMKLIWPNKEYPVAMRSLASLLMTHAFICSFPSTYHGLI